MRDRAIWLFCCLAASVLPRLPLFLRGSVHADDLVHLPAGHLESYRFLNFFELFAWQTLLGDDYLLGIAPKVVAALYSTAVCATLASLLIAWGVPPLAARAAALLVPLHPIWNTFFGWNVTAVYLLSLFLILLGYSLCARPRALAAGVLLVALGVSGYQVHAGLLPALLLAELLLHRDRRALRLRAAGCAAGVAVYLVATMIAARAGLESWGNRGAGIPFSGERLRAAAHGMMDNLAIVTQPLLSFHLGMDAIWRWWVPLVLLAAVGMIRRAEARRSTGGLVIVLPVVAAAVVLALNVVPTGPRVAGAIWIAAVIGAVPLLPRSRGGLAAVLVFAAIALPVTLADARNRVRAWQYDRAVVAQVRELWRSRGVPLESVTIEVVRTAARDEPDSRPIVMQNFQAVDETDYSNVRVSPQWLFRRFGFGPVVARDGEGAKGIAHDAAKRTTRITI